MTPQTADSKAKKKQQSQANRLVKVANSIELFHDTNGDGHATVPMSGHGETHRVRSRAFKRWLAGSFYRATNQVPQSQAMADAVNTLEGLAIFDGEEIETHIRVAEHDGKIYLDLANDAWQAVEISPDGWKVVDDPPVKFLRPAAMMMLPAPAHGGKIKELQGFVNVKSDQDFQLLVAFIVCALRPEGPYFCLNIGGEKGSAKSCLIDFIRMLIDPNKASVRSAPRSEDDLLIAAKHSWLLTADNLSELSRWLPLHPDAAALLKRLRVKSGGSIYPFIPLQRLAILAATEDITQEIPAAKLVNNMLRAFKVIQVRARAILAKRRAVKLEDVEWRIGNMHDLRKSFGTHMAKHVSMPELQRLMGHASITTTADYYVDLSDDVNEKVLAAFTATA